MLCRCGTAIARAEEQAQAARNYRSSGAGARWIFSNQFAVWLCTRCLQTRMQIYMQSTHMLERVCFLNLTVPRNTHAQLNIYIYVYASTCTHTAYYVRACIYGIIVHAHKHRVLHNFSMTRTLRNVCAFFMRLLALIHPSSKNCARGQRPHALLLSPL